MPWINHLDAQCEHSPYNPPQNLKSVWFQGQSILSADGIPQSDLLFEHVGF